MKVVAVTRPYRSGPLRRPGILTQAALGNAWRCMPSLLPTDPSGRLANAKSRLPRAEATPVRRPGAVVQDALSACPRPPAPGPRPREARVLLRDGEYEAIIDMCSVMAATVSGASPCAPLRNAEQGEMPKDMYSRPLSVSACASFGNWSLLGCSYPTAQP